MIGIAISLFLSVGAVGLTTAAIIHNQLDPNYGSALGVAYANLASLVIAGVGLVVAILTYHVNRERVLAKRTMIFAILSLAALLVLFPLANVGMVSRVH